MRVISGTAGGKRLIEPSGMDIRPTTDRVKEAIFDIIQFSVPGARVLDMFAGTGQLGIEALSRGASEAIFIDAAPASLKVIGENIRATGLSQRAKVVRGDSISAISGLGRFDIIFIDPPYDSELAEKAISAILRFDILNDDGIIIVETRSDHPDPPVEYPYRILKEYRYGKIKLIKYGRTVAGTESVEQ